MFCAPSTWKDSSCMGKKKDDGKTSYTKPFSPGYKLDCGQFLLPVIMCKVRLFKSSESERSLTTVSDGVYTCRSHLPP